MAGIGATTTRATSSSPADNGKKYRGPFAIMTSLFFLWGFMTVLNDILIPRFKEAFTLNYFHAMLVQFAFFTAYFVGSAIYFFISSTLGDPIAKIGYKNGIVIGLLLSAIGSALFWPAATLAPRSTTIAPVDFRHFPVLVQKLEQQKDPVSVYIFKHLSPATQEAINTPDNTQGETEKLKPMLAKDLNQLVQGPLIYNQTRFANVQLKKTTRQLLDQHPKGQGLIRLNRCLLEDAYAGMILRNLTSYWVFLGALFIVGLGFAMLQIAANPYVTILGPERTASSRLNLAQAFNSVGTTIGPLIGGYLILQYFARHGAHGAESVKVPYLVFCLVFVALTVIFFLIRLPHVGEGKVEHGMGSLKYPHVVLGVLAIFMYVGGEVSVGSSIINFLTQKSVAGLTAVEASKYVALFWGGMLIGRFMGAVELSEMKARNKKLFLAAIPIAAFAIVFALRGWDMARNYLPLLVLCWMLFQFGRALPGRTLTIFGSTIVLLLATTIIMGGKVAMWCVVGIGLFTSIGWPNIFSLALDGMGVYKSQVSSLLVMAILGGAILPLVEGHIADLGGLKIAFIVPLVAYAYVAFYGWKGHRIGRKKLA